MSGMNPKISVSLTVDPFSTPSEKRALSIQYDIHPERKDDGWKVASMVGYDVAEYDPNLAACKGMDVSRLAIAMIDKKVIDALKDAIMVVMLEEESVQPSLEDVFFIVEHVLIECSMSKWTAFLESYYQYNEKPIKKQIVKCLSGSDSEYPPIILNSRIFASHFHADMVLYDEDGQVTKSSWCEGGIIPPSERLFSVIGD